MEIKIKRHNSDEEKKKLNFILPPLFDNDRIFFAFAIACNFLSLLQVVQPAFKFFHLITCCSTFPVFVVMLFAMLVEFSMKKSR